MEYAKLDSGEDGELQEFVAHTKGITKDVEERGKGKDVSAEGKDANDVKDGENDEKDDELKDVSVEVEEGVGVVKN